MTKKDAAAPQDDAQATQKSSLTGDIIGGTVAGLYSVPEGIGYAQLAGLNPTLGIVDRGHARGHELLAEMPASQR